MIASILVSFVIYHSYIYKNAITLRMNKIESYDGLKFKFSEVVMKEKIKKLKKNKTSLKIQNMNRQDLLKKYPEIQVTKVQTIVRLHQAVLKAKSLKNMYF